MHELILCFTRWRIDASFKLEVLKVLTISLNINAQRLGA